MKMFSNGIDFVICNTIDEANQIVAEYYFNDTAEKEGSDPNIWGYYKCDLDKTKSKKPIYKDELLGDNDWDEVVGTFTLHTDDNDKIEKTVEEWIREFGYGYFASTEF